MVLAVSLVAAGLFMVGQYDIVVAGAGPAGSSCAERACELGLSVLVLEKERFPRKKPCAGAISSRALPLLPSGVEAVSHRAVHNIDIAFGTDYRYTWSDGSVAVATITREEFDVAMIRAASTAGADVEFGVAVEGFEDDGRRVAVSAGGSERTGRFLVAADGARGTLARRAGLPAQRMNAAIYVDVFPGNKGVLVSMGDTVLLDIGAVRRGYGWVFPKRDHLSVGVFTQAAGAAGLHRALAAFTRQWCAGASRTEGPFAAPVPYGGGAGRLAVGRMIAVGDAAGLADPITGEGISHAIASGRAAAEAVAAALESGEEAAAIYRSRIAADILPEVLKFERIGDFVYGLRPGVCRFLARAAPLRAVAIRFGRWGSSS